MRVERRRRHVLPLNLRDFPAEVPLEKGREEAVDMSRRSKSPICVFCVSGRSVTVCVSRWSGQGLARRDGGLP